jgi:hypothetical protein
MTKEEAQQILKNASCHCDGYGIVPGPKGIAIQCPDCDGKFISNDELKEARLVVGTS